jgi:hypothetical protein
VVEKLGDEDLVTAWSRTIKTCYDEQASVKILLQILQNGFKNTQYPG